MNDNNRFKNLAEKPGFFRSISSELRLILRLLRDKRVPFWTKLVPLGTLVYFFVPEPIPFIDDAIIMSLGVFAFIELCPEDLVKEHREALMSESRLRRSGQNEDVVIDEIAQDIERAQLPEVEILDEDLIDIDEDGLE